MTSSSPHRTVRQFPEPEEIKPTISTKPTRQTGNHRERAGRGVSRSETLKLQPGGSFWADLYAGERSA